MRICMVINSPTDKHLVMTVRVDTAFDDSETSRVTSVITPPALETSCETERFKGGPSWANPVKLDHCAAEN